MFQNFLGKVAFQISWFLLILGGMSLFERPYWGVLGVVFILFGTAIFFYAALAIYLSKLVYPKTRQVLTIAFLSIAVMIIIEFILRKIEVAILMTCISLPIPAALLLVRKNPKGVKKKQ